MHRSRKSRNKPRDGDPLGDDDEGVSSRGIPGGDEQEAQNGNNVEAGSEFAAASALSQILAEAGLSQITAGMVSESDAKRIERISRQAAVDAELFPCRECSQWFDSCEELSEHEREHGGEASTGFASDPLDAPQSNDDEEGLDCGADIKLERFS